MVDKLGRAIITKPNTQPIISLSRGCTEVCSGGMGLAFHSMFFLQNHASNALVLDDHMQPLSVLELVAVHVFDLLLNPLFCVISSLILSSSSSKLPCFLVYNQGYGWAKYSSGTI